MSFSLLFPAEFPAYRSTPPVFFEDLQLEGIFRAIVSKYMEFDIRKYFYTIPDSPETVRYRQEIYRDLEHNAKMLTGLKQYTNRLLACEKYFRLSRQAEDQLKKGSYLLLTCHNYLEALELLQKTLRGAELSSRGFTKCRGLLEQKFDDPDFQKFDHAVRASFSQMEQLQLTLLVRDQEISVLEDGTEADRRSVPQDDTEADRRSVPQDDTESDRRSVPQQLKQLIRAFDVRTDEAWEQAPDDVTNLFPAPLETSPLEDRIVDILKKSRPSVFSMLREFASFSFSPEGDSFVQLKNELCFYLSFYEFEQQLAAAGYELHVPETRKEGSVEITGVYDLALAWKNRFSGTSVVPNDISYRKGKSFLVITGPNQGGKTTLARAVGQCIYFMLMGLKAPCQSMKAPFFERILTHFEVEESVETGAGKLKEELQRLKPMMTMYADHSFVILNELFTTATTYDAEIMAKKVMDYFTRHGCLGIYVTHIQELADEMTQDGIQSMVAQVDEHDASVRTFKIKPMKAQGLGYSDHIVKKYGLDAEQVAQRIAGAIGGENG